MSREMVTRFRHHPGLAAAGFIVVISMVTLMNVSPLLALLLLPPAAYTGWVWRAGTDVDRDGLRVRALLGQRRIPWSEVSGLAPDGPGRVAAVLTSGITVPLTAVTTADLPSLIAASGQRLYPDDRPAPSDDQPGAGRR